MTLYSLRLFSCMASVLPVNACSFNLFLLGVDHIGMALPIQRGDMLSEADSTTSHILDSFLNYCT